MATETEVCRPLLAHLESIMQLAHVTEQVGHAGLVPGDVIMQTHGQRDGFARRWERRRGGGG